MADEGRAPHVCLVVVHQKKEVGSCRGISSPKKLLRLLWFLSLLQLTAHHKTERNLWKNLFFQSEDSEKENASWGGGGVLLKSGGGAALLGMLNSSTSSSTNVSSRTERGVFFFVFEGCCEGDRRKVDKSLTFHESPTPASALICVCCGLRSGCLSAIGSGGRLSKICKTKVLMKQCTLSTIWVSFLLTWIVGRIHKSCCPLRYCLPGKYSCHV